MSGANLLSGLLVRGCRRDHSGSSFNRQEVTHGILRRPGQDRGRSWWDRARDRIAALLLSSGLLGLVSLPTACCTDPAYNWNQAAERDLLICLDMRDTRFISLEQVARWIKVRYGKDAAWCAMLHAWSERTHGEPIARAGDFWWLSKQPTRVRELGWLINFQDAWGEEYKVVNPEK